MTRTRLAQVFLPLIVTALLAWTALPLALPPFRAYTAPELFETLLWQGMGAVGWPFALLGGALSLLFGASAANLGSLLMMLVYPAGLLLLARCLFAGELPRFSLALLHLLVVLSFAAVWYGVLNGYDFMAG